MAVLGAILAGGKARRLGGLAKPLIARPGDGTILSHAIAEFQAAGINHLAILANDPSPYRSFGLPVLADRHPDCGPLGGLEAAIYHALDMNCTAVFLVPGDLPQLRSADMRSLLAASDNGKLPRYAATPSGGHFAFAIVPTQARPLVEEQLREGRYSMESLLRRLGATAVPFDDETPFFNINTPDHLASWKSHQT